MPRQQTSVPAVSERLRRLQATLPELPVPVLLTLRDALEPLLERERLGARDVTGALKTAGVG